MIKGVLIPTVLITCLSSPCLAQETSKLEPKCDTLENVQKLVSRAGSSTIRSLKPAQFNFLQGIYAMAPDTPPGLPPGEDALLLTRDNDEDNGYVLWVRGTLVCDPWLIPKKLIELIDEVLQKSEDKGL